MDRRFIITLAIFAIIALVLLWGEHKVHLLGALPWLVLLACPLIHIFMHDGHGGHGGHRHQGGNLAKAENSVIIDGASDMAFGAGWHCPLTMSVKRKKHSAPIGRLMLPELPVLFRN